MGNLGRPIIAEILKVENLHVHFETAAGQVKALNGVSFVQEEDRVFLSGRDERQ